MKLNTVNDCNLITVPNVHDQRGQLAVIEKDTLPFEIKRVYYLYDVPSDAYRGGHAHKKLHQVLIALSGSFKVILKDGKQTRTVILNKPNKALFLVPGIWREIDDFSSGAVCLVLASETYDEDDYIRNFKDFELFKGT